MGLKRKLTARVELILPQDDAVKGGYLEYSKDFDRSKLVLEGEPTVFAIEPLTRRQKDLCERCGAGTAAKWAAVQCGLRDVVGYVTERADGTTEILPSPKTTATDFGGVLISEEWCDDANFEEDVLDALAAAIRKISGLSPL